MKTSIKLFLCQIITSSIVAIVLLIVWFGVFFGATYPEIRVKETFLETTCTVLATRVISSKCCSKSCTHCTSCGGGPTCSSLNLAINTTSSCCNGYKCCSRCCDRCKRCSNGSCTYYDCNCRCCRSVSNLLCEMNCRECWTPTVTMQYETLANTSVISNMQKSCSHNYNCVNEYLSNWPINSTSTCFYNPRNEKEFATSNEYTPYKFGIMYTFSVLTIISVIWLLLVLTIALCFCLKSKGFFNINFTRSISVNPHNTNNFNVVYDNTQTTVNTSPNMMTELVTQLPTSHSNNNPTFIPVQPTNLYTDKKLEEPTQHVDISEVYLPPQIVAGVVVGGNEFYEPTAGNEQLPNTTTGNVDGYAYHDPQPPYPTNNTTEFDPSYLSYNPNANSFGGENHDMTTNNPTSQDQFISYAPTNF